MLPHNGRFFATDISVHYKDIQRKCRFREAGGAYEQVWEFYLTVRISMKMMFRV